ncbi:hypothetical protein E2C01_060269 [Portunus trituberculatus]|uniref:Uncharacterized protein n=1 Tax=Portunus trituberculatus TaxID=210409 RepID=A0A5B7HBL0_PORTR|nr:hypothetical protein [Portunus trituberculatus]
MTSLGPRLKFLRTSNLTMTPPPPVSMATTPPVTCPATLQLVTHFQRARGRGHTTHRCNSQVSRTDRTSREEHSTEPHTCRMARVIFVCECRGPREERRRQCGAAKRATQHRRLVVPLEWGLRQPTCASAQPNDARRSLF